MPATINTHHTQYDEFLPLWKKASDFIAGEEAVKAEKTTYLPKPSGMAKNDNDGSQYAAYLQRARVYDLVNGAQSAMLGLAFEKQPEGNPDEEFSVLKEDDIDFSVTVLRELALKGRYIAIVDNYAKTGVDYRVAGYVAESMINWKVDTDGQLTLAVFEEEVLVDDPEDPYSHETQSQFRVYSLEGNSYTIKLYDEEGEQLRLSESQLDVTVPRDSLDIVVFGSINLTGDCDPVPLAALVNCSIALYQLSADYRHALYMAAQPTPWVKGITKEQWELLLEQGIGSSALWWLGDEGEAQFLETSGSSINSLRQAMQDEFKIAENHAVLLTQQEGGIESAASMAMRAASQHATLHTIIRSLEEGINRLHEIIKERGGGAAKDFAVKADFTPQYANAQMVAAVSNAVGLSTVPQSVLFNLLRQAKATEKTDEELMDEISTTGGSVLPAPPPANEG